MRKLLLPVIAALTLTGCSPQLQKGGWLVPVGLFVAAVYSFYRSTKRKDDNAGPLLFAVALLAAALIMTYAMSKDL